MSWVKLDDQFPDHPKIEAAGEGAAWLFVCGLCYCAEHLTDGFIPRSKAQRLTTRPQPRIAALLRSGLWDEVEGGYQVRGYLEYQPAGAEVRERRADISEKRSRAGKKGAVARWGDGKSDGNGDGKSDGNDMAPSPSPTDVSTSSEGRTSVGADVPPAAAPLHGRISRPSTAVELVEPSGPVAIRAEATTILDEVDRTADHRLTPTERRRLRPVIEEALRTTSYEPRDLVTAIASSPFRTEAAVMGELRKAKQPGPTSVGNRGLGAVERFLGEGA